MSAIELVTNFLTEVRGTFVLYVLVKCGFLRYVLLYNWETNWLFKFFWDSDYCAYLKNSQIIGPLVFRKKECQTVSFPIVLSLN
jgi:hypothetical protein